MAQGLQVFSNLTLAIQAGYEVFDRHYKTSEGQDAYLLRIKTDRGWAMAIYKGEVCQA